MDLDPQAFWADVLSRDPGKIRAAFEGLSEEEKGAVLAHLRRMAEEEGWQEGQRQAARAALQALGKSRDP